MTETQRKTVAHIAMLAESAARDLGQNAANGVSARPSVAQLNRTMERLASIERLAREVLGNGN